MIILNYLHCYQYLVNRVQPFLSQYLSFMLWNKRCPIKQCLFVYFELVYLCICVFVDGVTSRATDVTTMSLAGNGDLHNTSGIFVSKHPPNSSHTFAPQDFCADEKEFCPLVRPVKDSMFQDSMWQTRIL